AGTACRCESFRRSKRRAGRARPRPAPADPPDTGATPRRAGGRPRRTSSPTLPSLLPIELDGARQLEPRRQVPAEDPVVLVRKSGPLPEAQARLVLGRRLVLDAQRARAGLTRRLHRHVHHRLLDLASHHATAEEVVDDLGLATVGLDADETREP